MGDFGRWSLCVFLKLRLQFDVLSQWMESENNSGVSACFFLGNNRCANWHTCLSQCKSMGKSIFRPSDVTDENRLQELASKAAKPPGGLLKCDWPILTRVPVASGNRYLFWVFTNDFAADCWQFAFTSTWVDNTLRLCSDLASGF